MLEEPIPDHIVDRIAKLMAKAKSAESIGSQAEAEAFAAKVHELCNEYNLELQQIEAKGEKSSILEFLVEDKDMYLKNESDWLELLWRTIARFNYCKVIIYTAGHKKKNYGLGIFGKPGNIEIVKYIVSQLSSKCRIFAKEQYKAYISQWSPTPPEKRNSYLRGFYKGFVKGIETSLAEQQMNEEIINPNLQGLVISNRNQIQEYIERNLGKTSTYRGKEGKSSSAHGREAGYKTGLTTTINKGIQTNGSNQRLLN